MSIQAMAWVIDNSRAEGSDFVVLLMLANHYNHENGRCNPGYRRIAEEARVGRSTVGDAVERLIKLGELEVIRTGAGNRTTEYHFPWLSTGDASVREPDTLRPDSVRITTSSVRAEGHSVRPGPDRSLNQEPLTANFDNYQRCGCGYPRLADHDECPWCHDAYDAGDPDRSLVSGHIPGPADTQAALEALERTREVVKSKGRHPSALFDDVVSPPEDTP